MKIQIAPHAHVFGHGDHDSTLLLLRELRRYVTGGERVLDLGCGTGILGICALKLGAAHVDGVDIDPVAVEEARKNADLNGVADCMTVGEACPERRYALALVNIGVRVHKRLAPELVERLAPGGLLMQCVMQGEQREAVAAFPRLELLALPSRGEWIGPVLKMR